MSRFGAKLTLNSLYYPVTKSPLMPQKSGTVTGQNEHEMRDKRKRSKCARASVCPFHSCSCPPPSKSEHPLSNDRKHIFTLLQTGTWLEGVKHDWDHMSPANISFAHNLFSSFQIILDVMARAPEIEPCVAGQRTAAKTSLARSSRPLHLGWCAVL